MCSFHLLVLNGIYNYFHLLTTCFFGVFSHLLVLNGIYYYWICLFFPVCETANGRGCLHCTWVKREWSCVGSFSCVCVRWAVKRHTSRGCTSGLEQNLRAPFLVLKTILTICAPPRPYVYIYIYEHIWFPFPWTLALPSPEGSKPRVHGRGCIYIYTYYIYIYIYIYICASRRWRS